MESKSSKNETALIVISILLFFGLLVGGYMYYILDKKFKESKQAYSENEEILQEKIESLEKEVFELTETNSNLNEALYTEQNKNLVFEKQIEEISGTVGTLEKLSKVDPELLQKYSKVYFLNEHYIPSSISQIPEKYVYDKDDEAQWIHSGIWPFLKDMLEKAEKDGVNLRIISAYRTFHEQASVKEGHVITYGAGTANQFSAEQGYSEHQLGTTVDFTTPETGANFSKFKDTQAYDWLLENAHKFGFTLSYPEDNPFYHFEPWHWRFVGTKLSTRLYEEGENFYDLEQREIDEYLISIFD